MTVVGCLNMMHNAIDCKASGLPFAQWCDRCKEPFTDSDHAAEASTPGHRNNCPDCQHEKIQNHIMLIPGQPVLARFLGPHRAATVDLFGTDLIPCPWDSREPRQDILEAIQKQNPGCVVYWEGDK